MVQICSRFVARFSLRVIFLQTTRVSWSLLTYKWSFGSLDVAVPYRTPIHNTVCRCMADIESSCFFPHGACLKGLSGRSGRTLALLLPLNPARVSPSEKTRDHKNLT